MMFPGLHPMVMMSTSGMGYPRAGTGYQGGIYGAGPAPYPMYPGGPPPAPGGPAESTVVVLNFFLFIIFKLTHDKLISYVLHCH